MPREITIPRDSVEYVKAVVTSDATLTGTVQISVSTAGAYVWQAAEWTGAEATRTWADEYGVTHTEYQRTARTTATVTFSAGNYPRASYLVHAKVATTPESTIVACGRIQLT